MNIISTYVGTYMPYAKPHYNETHTPTRSAQKVSRPTQQRNKYGRVKRIEEEESSAVVLDLIKGHTHSADQGQTQV